MKSKNRVHLNPTEHYLVRNKRVFLIKSKVEKLLADKITGSKIELFFDLKDEEEKDKKQDPEFHTPFRVWKRVISWESLKRSPLADEEIKNAERQIIDYLNKHTRSTWEPYPANSRDVFKNHQYLGGVPDAVERKGLNTVNVLEIKTVLPKPDSESLAAQILAQIPSKYLLQLAFYLFLNGLEEGYLTVCSIKNSVVGISGRNFQLTAKPEQIPIPKEDWEKKNIGSYIPEIGGINLKYKVLEIYRNNYKYDNELLLIKVKFDMDKYGAAVARIQDWFIKHKFMSPEMTDKELKEVLWLNGPRKNN